MLAEIAFEAGFRSVFIDRKGVFVLNEGVASGSFFNGFEEFELFFAGRS
jgi:hypothetical protein